MLHVPLPQECMMTSYKKTMMSSCAFDYRHLQHRTSVWKGLTLKFQHFFTINTLRFYVSVCLSVSDGSGMFVGRD